MKAHDKFGTTVNVEIINDERPLFFFRGEQIVDLDKFNPGPDALNDLEKAKDSLYDLPLFDGEFIVSRFADWEVKQRAFRKKHFLTAEDYYASAQDAYIDNENVADCDVHISFGECGDLYGQTNIDAFFFDDNLTGEETFFAETDLETVLIDILYEALVSFVAGESDSKLISHIAEEYGNDVRGEVAWMESQWDWDDHTEDGVSDENDELVEHAASAIAKILLGDN